MVFCVVASLLGPLEPFTSRPPPKPLRRSGGEEESQQLFDARAALVRLHALLSLAPGGAAVDDEEVYEGLHRLLEVRVMCLWLSSYALVVPDGCSHQQDSLPVMFE